MKLPRASTEQPASQGGDGCEILSRHLLHCTKQWYTIQTNLSNNDFLRSVQINAYYSRCYLSAAMEAKRPSHQVASSGESTWNKPTTLALRAFSNVLLKWLPQQQTSQ